MLAGLGLEKHRSKTFVGRVERGFDFPDVRPLAGEDLGRAEGWCAEENPGTGETAGGELSGQGHPSRDAEIEDFHHFDRFTHPADHDVGRFEVPMDQPRTMCFGDGVTALEQDPDHPLFALGTDATCPAGRRMASWLDPG